MQRYLGTAYSCEARRASLVAFLLAAQRACKAFLCTSPGPQLSGIWEMSSPTEQSAHQEEAGIPGLTEEERHKAAISVQVRKPFSTEFRSNTDLV